MKTVSFDYDSTLTNDEVFNYALQLKRRGYRVIIVTQRPPQMHRDVFNTAMALGMQLTDIVFCGVRKKESVLEEMEYMFHLDDKTIRAKRCVVYNENFKNNCEKLL